ncbi:MAG: ATP-grasp domain-containing protein [bacterium]|nr:ATP-grasp domain-containing protein [bacterium]
MSVRRLLVANRGEIARRIFGTCEEMGIEAVAVFSEADREAAFVSEADLAVSLGGFAPSESYLRAEAIVEAALRVGADAVHPGYGFLSEDAGFARQVIGAGLTWVGPPPRAMELMGDKLAAKELMARAGVPVLSAALPGEASEIGFPVMVKAAAGGGGRGMRIVRSGERLAAEVESARREAEAAFGDGRVFLERLVEDSRHIEVQVMADAHGNTAVLYERECSIQRRHQKIVEEAPSPFVDEDLRGRLSEAAVAAAEAVDYVGAGTVEFLVARDGEFWFLEMNTRLQVEHPVTEEITGLDLVRLQIEAARGKDLSERLRGVSARGHAIEARIYAEDPAAGFLPTAGRMHRFELSGRGIRVETGVESGDEIGVHYDPMLAKVVAWAPGRDEAAARLSRALRRASIHGPVTNRDLLVRILEHPEFLAGRTDTGFLERHSPAELGRPLPTGAEERLSAVAAALAAQAGRRESAGVLSTIPSGWRNNPSQLQVVDLVGVRGEIRVGYSLSAGVVVEVDGEALGVTGLSECGPDRVGLEVDGVLGFYRVNRVGDTHYVDGPGGLSRLVEKDRYPMPGGAEQSGSLQAPMPGRVVEVISGEGDQVEKGQVLVVMEAMKMEHGLRAPHPGKVVSVLAAPGEQVESGQVLVVMAE